MKKILIVDDDLAIRELIRLYFTKEGFKVLDAETGEDALYQLKEESVDAVLLDLMLPGKSGYDVLRELRTWSDVPVLILTARGETLDKVVGLELGADDYVEKPFDAKELIARVKAVQRRATGHVRPLDVAHQTAGNEQLSKEELDNVVRCSNLVVDCNAYAVTIDHQEVELAPKELELLFFLAKHPNRVFSRDQILDQIWDFDFVGGTRTVDVHIKRIREKLERYPHPDWAIATVWRVGYKFEVFNHSADSSGAQI